MASEREQEEHSLSDDEAEDSNVHEDDDADEVEEAAEVLMTDMTLDDDMDKIRDPDPGSSWVFHIEVYPWNAEDVNERFIRLMKLATFTKLCVRKKPVSHESDDLERIDDKVMERQRKGSLHLYAETYQTARAILRHSTWSSMVSQELTFDITKRNLDTGNLMKARIDVDTGWMSKVKFRNKTKGSFMARSAKVTNLPVEATRDFLDVVFCRSYVAYSGPDAEPCKENKDVNMQQTLGEIPGFNGFVDVDCLTRGSCRSLVLAIKSVSVLGNRLTVTANDPQTMVMPQEPQTGAGFKPKEEDKNKSSPNLPGTSSGLHSIQIVTSSGRGREVRTNNMAAIGRNSAVTRINGPMAAHHVVQSARINPTMVAGRPRGTMGVARGMVAAQQPTCSSFTRSGQGMPVPMTGRQKMNEKIRRNNPNMMMGMPNTGVHPAVSASAGYRAANMKSIGDSFKQEIASLQSELERSTQAIEAKIERLKEESSYYNGYNDDMQMFAEGEWGDISQEYQYELGQEEYFDDNHSDYYSQGYEGYDISTHDAMGYEQAAFVEQQLVEPIMMMPSASRGGLQMQKRGAGGLAASGRGGRGGVVRIPAQHRPSGGGFIVGGSNNNNNMSGRNSPNPNVVRNPAAGMRNVRGRGGRGGGGMVYHGTGGSASDGGYW